MRARGQGPDDDQGARRAGARWWSLPQGGDRLARHPRPRRVAGQVRSRVQLQPPASRPGSRPLEVRRCRCGRRRRHAGRSEWLWCRATADQARLASCSATTGADSGGQERHAHPGPAPAHRRGSGEVPGVRRDRAWRVQLYARDAPDTPASEVLTAQERYVIDTLSSRGRLLPPRQRGRPPPGDIRSYVVRLARTVGFIEAAPATGQRDPVADLAGRCACWRRRPTRRAASRIRRRSLSPPPHFPLARERPSRHARQRRVPRGCSRPLAHALFVRRASLPLRCRRPRSRT